MSKNGEGYITIINNLTRKLFKVIIKERMAHIMPGINSQYDS